MIRRRTRALLGRPAPATVKVEQPIRYTIGFGKNGEHFFAALTAAMSETGLTFVEGGSPRTGSRRINVRQGDLATAVRLAASACSVDDVVVRSPGRWRRPLNDETAESVADLKRALDLLIPEAVVGDAPPHIASSRIELAPWKDVEVPSGAEVIETTTTNTVAARIKVKTFERLASEGYSFGEDIPAADTPQFPVDIVYTWVDGDDPKWAAEKERWSAKRAASSKADRVVHDERFRNRNELKYSLRSVEQFAPWVRKIHIVTAGQQPDWLDTSHPKINLIDHRDVYADDTWLPTFNSSGIETQLHHIPGLSAKFLYFNDDFFLGQLAEKQDFFLGNGVLKYFPSDQKAFEQDIDRHSEEYIQADKNAIELFGRDFSSTNRDIMQHSPYPSDTALLYELEDRYTKEFAACASSRFRSSQDLRPIAFMQYHFGFHKRMSVPSSITHRYLALWKPTILKQLDGVEKNRKYKTFCINDVGLQPERTAEINEAVIAFCERYFPVPSAFELTAE